jgi:hypothetical protein
MASVLPLEIFERLILPRRQIEIMCQRQLPSAGVFGGVKCLRKAGCNVSTVF